MHWTRYSFTNLFDDEGNLIVAVCTSTLIDKEKEIEIQIKYEIKKKRALADSDNLLVHAQFNLTT